MGEQKVVESLHLVSLQSRDRASRAEGVIGEVKQVQPQRKVLGQFRTSGLPEKKV